LPGPHERLCAHCQQADPAFERVQAPWLFTQPLQQLLHQFKFHGSLAAGNTLGRLFAQQLEIEAKPDLIIPVPLHPKRLRERGYNQAAELARPIGKLLNLPLDTRSLQRIRHTNEQSSLNAKERRRNLRGAFHCNADLQNKRVVIVDDVVTTGSTANEIAKTLRRAGARHIEIWAAARASRHESL